ncbi:MAG: aldehyde ferredoxin oxidoreductase, partial [Methanomicrobiales archaeon]|nr:aldehyde ferredoxin oxidoreductase [Methanomicrobiales archaeon]
MQGPQAGTIIFVHLDTRKIEQIRPPSGLQQKYLGGRGVGVHLVSEQVDPQIDACDPANILIFSAGLFTGTGLPFGARYDLVTKSPLTGTLSSSNSGGVFGSALKRTGIDALVLGGASPEPVYLWITNGGAEICDANDYWGMTTRECNRALLRDRQEPEVKVACIGPAGEHLCRFASVMNDASRAAGRGGAGAVMGAKKVKAVVVRSEKRRERISTGMRGALEIAKTSIEKSGIARGSLHRYGTSSMVNLVNEAHLLPVRNFQESHAPSAENFSGEEIEQSILTGRITCYACPVACGRLTAIAGHQGEGPEFETIWAFGPDCGIDNLSTITAANYLCNDLGLDTISAGATIACAMEMTEKGHIREGPRFGDEDGMLALIKDIAYRRGMGDELAEGSFRFASRHGHPEISMSVKMMEIPAYDPRGMQGQGLEYATSVRGACHVYGNIRYPELLGIPFRLDP